jgi:transcriptional regulator
MRKGQAEILRGTLDLMVLRILDTLGTLHGYGMARRLEQVADGALSLNQGTLYPALLRLQHQGWIRAEWGTSDNNRRARYYSLTRTGQRQLIAEARAWHLISAIIDRLLAGAR